MLALFENVTGVRFLDILYIKRLETSLACMDGRLVSTARLSIRKGEGVRGNRQQKGLGKSEVQIRRPGGKEKRRKGKARVDRKWRIS